MKRQSPIRRGAAAMFVGLTLLTASCIDDPGAEPIPPAAYKRASASFCEQIGMKDVLRERWQLSSPPEGVSDPYYGGGPRSWNASCRFGGVAEDGRYATGVKFQPAGSVTVTVFDDIAEAELRYGEQADGEKRRVPNFRPSGSVAEVSGWWDSGISVKLITAVDSGPLGFEDPGSTRLARELLVRHDNLLARSTVEASVPTADREEAGNLLDEIASVLLDETVKHLPRTNG